MWGFAFFARKIVSEKRLCFPLLPLMCLEVNVIEIANYKGTSLKNYVIESFFTYLPLFSSDHLFLSISLAQNIVLNKPILDWNEKNLSAYY